MKIKTRIPNDKVDIIEINCESLNFRTRLIDEGRFGEHYKRMNICEISFKDSRDLIFFTDALTKAIKQSEMYQDKYFFEYIDEEMKQYLK